ncbi:MAG: type II toxin-antitoxin system RelE/ParE family toxin [Gammaproteobacteria bacterium]
MTIRKLDISKHAADFLLQLPPKHCKQCFTTILRLTKFPHPQDSKKLQGYEELYRVDTGEYRVIYRVDEDTIYISLIGKRNDGEIYHQLKGKN